MFINKTIFISPLDWGFGHATRCVPLIRQLSQHNRIIIGVTEVNRIFFDIYFPGLQKIQVPSYKIRYSENLLVWLKILIQWPQIKAVIKEEEKALAQFVKEHKIDVVISDNRFGLHNPKTENIFITHQLHLKTPFGFGVANRINLNYIHRFSKVWVPDYSAEHARLAGDLANSNKIKIPVEYIGPLSALKDVEIKSIAEYKSDLLILLSGVEPQRSILENILLEKFRNSTQKIVLVRGSNRALEMENKNITRIDFAFGAELKALILGAGTVLCRSGYSTLMDLHVLGKKKLIIVPTPGQTEQEYLAQYWEKQFDAVQLAQQDIKNSSLPFS